MRLFSHLSHLYALRMLPKPTTMVRTFEAFAGLAKRPLSTSLLYNNNQLRYFSDSKSNDPTQNEAICQQKQAESQTTPECSEEFDSVQLNQKEQEKLVKFAKVFEGNSYYNKYKAKIVNFQRSSPHAFLALVEQFISPGDKKKKEDTPKSKTLQNRKKLVLDDIMKLSSLQSLDREDISFIWTEYHNSGRMVAAVMSSNKHESIVKKAHLFNSFVFPLPRGDQYDFFLAQYGDDSFYFTPLAVYHKYQENSPVCLTLSHFDELKESKDLILLRGEHDKDVISLKEAQHLTVQLNCYYAETNDRRFALMKNFNQNTSNFQHMDLITELNNLESEFSEVFPKLK